MDPKVIIAISVVLGIIALVTLPFYLVIIPVIGILYGLWRLTELFVDMRKETRSSANMKRAGYTAGMFVGLMVVLAVLGKLILPKFHIEIAKDKGLGSGELLENLFN